ncbi:MAG: hypothetical protein ACE37I_15870 [Rubinisphaera brasiliensis]|uniref:hypothetical protein n=1 Tax=Rubinisphaera brasiliensis TaxID=119 RepID=UPI0039192344
MHRGSWVVCCLLVVVGLTTLRSEEKVESTGVLGISNIYRKEPSFKPYGQSHKRADEISDYLTSIGKGYEEFGEEKDFVRYTERVEAFSANVGGPFERALFLMSAGKKAVQIGLDLKDAKNDLHKKWIAYGESLSRRTIVQAQVAQVESQLLIAEAFYNIAKACEDDESREDMRIKAYQEMADVVVDIREIQDYVYHGGANKYKWRLYEDALFSLLRELPQGELAELAIDPKYYERALRTEYYRSKRAKVVSPLLKFNVNLLVYWIETIGGSSLVSEEEKDVLTEAVGVVEDWEERVSAEYRQGVEKKVPAPPEDPFGTR